MIRHRKIKGRCYIYETKESYVGPCGEHNSPKKAKKLRPEPKAATTAGDTYTFIKRSKKK
ncbi:MAG: hypothetical protein JRN50_02155 [Nitrososphaerota archaeon]|nr:hypothetical protein [Nitrososphaerota archaeon]